MKYTSLGENTDACLDDLEKQERDEKVGEFNDSFMRSFG